MLMEVSTKMWIYKQTPLTLFWGLEMVGVLHSTVSPLNMKVPLAAGVVDHETFNFTTVEFARGSTTAYRFFPLAFWMSCPPVI